MSSGIFGKPTALGATFSVQSLGAVDVGKCTFATWTSSEGARAVQQELVKRGATNLKVDGLWGPCSESAWRKITGVPLTQDALQSQFNINCSSFYKAGTFDPAKCTNGTDAVVAVSTPPEVPTATHPPVVCNPPYVADPTTGGCKLAPKPAVPDVPKPDAVTKVTAPPMDKLAVPPPAPIAKTQLIDGVPNTYLLAGGVVAASLAFWLLSNKSTKRAIPNSCSGCGCGCG
jgi:hypothetical protein